MPSRSVEPSYGHIPLTAGQPCLVAWGNLLPTLVTLGSTVKATHSSYSNTFNYIYYIYTIIIIISIYQIIPNSTFLGSWQGADAFQIEVAFFAVYGMAFIYFCLRISVLADVNVEGDSVLTYFCLLWLLLRCHA